MLLWFLGYYTDINSQIEKLVAQCIANIWKTPQMWYDVHQDVWCLYTKMYTKMIQMYTKTPHNKNVTQPQKTMMSHKPTPPLLGWCCFKNQKWKIVVNHTCIPQSHMTPTTLYTALLWHRPILAPIKTDSSKCKPFSGACK